MELLLLREGRSFTVYSLETGDSVADFLKELERNNRAEFARMMRRLEQLADRGPSRQRTEFNDLDNGLYEAKSKGGGRVVFFYDAGRIVICACGFAKKSRKTPARAESGYGTKTRLRNTQGLGAGLHGAGPRRHGRTTEGAMSKVVRVKNRFDFQKGIERARKQVAYYEEDMLLDVSARIIDTMERKGVNRSELARRLDVTPAYVRRSSEVTRT